MIDVSRYAHKFTDRPPTGAVFRVVKIDPDGSGMAFLGHLGAEVTNADRCCKNCGVIFGTMGGEDDVGPFLPGELEPVNDAAHEVLVIINTHLRSLGKAP